MAKRSLLSQTGRIAREVLPAVLKPLRALWNEVIALLFFALAILGLSQGVRLYFKAESDPDSFFKLALTSVFVLVMAGFGFSSLLRARKISKS